MSYDFSKQYRELWTLLAIENHIVQSLKKKGNAKQNAELARQIFTELEPEIVRDLTDWYRKRSGLGDEIDPDSVKLDILHRINGELAKYNVPLLSFELFR